MVSPQLGSQTEPDTDPLADERRAAERFASDKNAWCHTLTGRMADPTLARVRDISASGIALVLGRRFELGTLVAVELEQALDGDAERLLARAVRLAVQPDGSWLVGCVFPRELGEEQLAAYREQLARGDGAQCRAWVRLTGSLLTFYKLDPDLWPGQWPATIMRTSPEAITLLVTCRLEPGTRVKVEVGAADGQGSRAERAQVVEAKEEEDGLWALHCKIIRESADTKS